MELAIYCKIKDYAVDENGEKDYAGLRVGLGEVPKNISYEELTKNIDLQGLAEFVGLKDYEIQIITPEEYERDYGED